MFPGLWRSICTSVCHDKHANICCAIYGSQHAFLCTFFLSHFPFGGWETFSKYATLAQKLRLMRHFQICDFSPKVEGE